MQADSKRMLGEILMELGLLDRAQLRLGLVHHHEMGVPLGRALVREGLCTEAGVLRALAQQAGFPAIDLDREPLQPKLTRLVSKRVARKYRAIPLRLEKGEREVLHIALPAPASLEALDAVRAVAGKPRVEPHVASDPAISRALFALYRFQEQPEPPMRRPSQERGPDAPVLLYAWPPVTATLISRSLAREGIRTRVISPLETLHTTASDLVFAPVQAMEGLLAGEARIGGTLLLSGSSDDEDLARAHRIGAKGYVANPLDDYMLLRAIRRLRPRAGEGSGAQGTV
ncbi:general secretion pathway protein GspE [Cystobacter ferrugineus]|uniref:General secretion pathway protein GspE n=1 Tax=Cystobacter ferrugineus TaxID=83449 RepID=A0A1L9B5K8_9BACT|nr:general secretion pathway protein GspE [Cystobacter ferrugineus]OJH37538.1 general secretion pathway protein GspE [Cystobacter ferrugineus]